jgi:exoribonuclease-2
LLAIVADFDAAYAEYNAFQSAVERYWSLRSLLQDDIHELDAAVMKDGLVRADNLPLVFRAAGAESLPRGARVRVRLGSADLLTLDLQASVVSRIGESLAVETAAQAADATEDDDAGPLTIAVDVAGGEAIADTPVVAESAAA